MSFVYFFKNDSDKNHNTIHKIVDVCKEYPHNKYPKKKI